MWIIFLKPTKSRRRIKMTREEKIQEMKNRNKLKSKI